MVDVSRGALHIQNASKRKAGVVPGFSPALEGLYRLAWDE